MTKLLSAGIIVPYRLKLSGDCFVPVWLGHSFQSVTGFEPKEMMADPNWWEHHLHPEDRNNARAALARVLEEGRVVHSYRFKFADGKYHWIQDSLEIDESIKNDAVHISGHWLETTELIEVDKKLHETIRELEIQKSTLDQHAIVSVCNVKGDITYVNNKFCEISGYSREELLGNNHRIVKSEHHDKAFYRDLWKTIANGGTWHGQIRNRRKNGDSYWVNATIVPFMNENGKPFQYVAIRTDITPRMMALEELKTTNEELEKANQVKSAFLSSMSHELRTPLNAIIGFAQLLEMDELDEEQTSAIGEILLAGNSLLSLVNNVLDLAKIEDGNLSASIDEFHPGLPIRQCLGMVESMAKRYEIEIGSHKIPGDLPTILADRGRFKQVLLNLLSNSLKYNGPGGTVDVILGVVNTGYLRVAIKDSGSGIPKGQQDKIFEPFNRLGKETSHVEGAGIGLVISKELVKMMGGQMGFESEEGIGSTFWFELPVSAGAQLTEE